MILLIDTNIGDLVKVQTHWTCGPNWFGVVVKNCIVIEGDGGVMHGEYSHHVSIIRTDGKIFKVSNPHWAECVVISKRIVLK